MSSFMPKPLAKNPNVNARSAFLGSQAGAGFQDYGRDFASTAQGAKAGLVNRGMQPQAPTPPALPQMMQQAMRPQQPMQRPQQLGHVGAPGMQDFSQQLRGQPGFQQLNQRPAQVSQQQVQQHWNGINQQNAQNNPYVRTQDPNEARALESQQLARGSGQTVDMNDQAQVAGWLARQADTARLHGQGMPGVTNPSNNGAAQHQQNYMNNYFNQQGQFAPGRAALPQMFRGS